MDTICLDNLIQRYINQTNSAVDYDETRSRLLDGTYSFIFSLIESQKNLFFAFVGTMLDNLIHHYSARDEYRY